MMPARSSPVAEWTLSNTEARALALSAPTTSDCAVLARAADDRHVADRRVPLRELGHDRRQHLEHALREEGVLVRGDGLGLGLESCGTGVTLGADRLGLGSSLQASGVSLGLGLRAQRVGLTGGARDGSRGLTGGAGLVASACCSAMRVRASACLTCSIAAASAAARGCRARPERGSRPRTAARRRRA